MPFGDKEFVALISQKMSEGLESWRISGAAAGPSETERTVLEKNGAEKFVRLAKFVVAVEKRGIRSVMVAFAVKTRFARKRYGLLFVAK